MDKRIFHLRERFSRDLARNWTVEEMAAAAKVSAPHLHRLFRTENDGVTPRAYLNDLRLDEAANMLADPDCLLRISEIGAAVGLLNESNFARDFKDKYDMTPSQFQKHHAEIHQSRSPDESDE